MKRLFRMAAITLLALGLFAGPAYAHIFLTGDIKGITWRDTYGLNQTTFYGSGTYACGHDHHSVEIRVTLQQEYPMGSADYRAISPTNTKVFHNPGSCPISRQVSETCSTVGNTFNFRVKITVITRNVDHVITGNPTVYRGQQAWFINCHNGGP